MSTALLPTNHKKAHVKASKPLANIRRCLVTGKEKNKEKLIRFVLDPSNVVTPDLLNRLPGRGLWVSADRSILDQAIKKNLFSKSAKSKAVIPDNFIDKVEVLLKRRCLELLGLARSAGATVTGLPQIENGLKSGKIDIVLMASDAKKDCRKKLSRVAIVETGLTRIELGASLGKEHLVTVGMRSYNITEKLLTEFVRWHGVVAQIMNNRDILLDSVEI